MVKKVIMFSSIAENQGIWSMTHTSPCMPWLLMEKSWPSSWRDSLPHFAHKGCCCTTLEHEFKKFKSLARSVRKRKRTKECWQLWCTMPSESSLNSMSMHRKWWAVCFLWEASFITCRGHCALTTDEMFCPFLLDDCYRRIPRQIFKHGKKTGLKYDTIVNMTNRNTGGYFACCRRHFRRHIGSTVNNNADKNES